MILRNERDDKEKNENLEETEKDKPVAKPMMPLITPEDPNEDDDD